MARLDIGDTVMTENHENTDRNTVRIEAVEVVSDINQALAAAGITQISARTCLDRDSYTGKVRIMTEGPGDSYGIHILDDILHSSLSPVQYVLAASEDAVILEQARKAGLIGEMQTELRVFAIQSAFNVLAHDKPDTFSVRADARPGHEDGIWISNSDSPIVAIPRSDIEAEGEMVGAFCIRAFNHAIHDGPYAEVGEIVEFSRADRDTFNADFD